MRLQDKNLRSEALLTVKIANPSRNSLVCRGSPKAGPFNFSFWGAMPTLVLRRGHGNRRENMATAEYRRDHGTLIFQFDKALGYGEHGLRPNFTAAATETATLMRPW